MPRSPKIVASHRKDKKPKKKISETAEDWLEEAITLEDSGDRWVQDPPKAERFYAQALEAYERALSLDKTLFDAAYNRSRLYLQISQSCALLAIPRLDTVKSAIKTHRELISQYPENSDIKYNLAIVFMYYVELVSEHKLLEAGQTDGTAEAALKEAFELLEQCRIAQSAELAQLTSDIASDEDATADAGIKAAENPMQNVEEVAMDVSYISSDILYDTLISFLECYVQLLEFDSLTDIDSVTKIRDLIDSVIHAQIKVTLPQCQSNDVQTRFADVLHSISLAELEFSYRQKTITIEEWKERLEQIIGGNSAPSVSVLCSNTDACIALASSQSLLNVNPSEIWKILSIGASSQISSAIQIMQQTNQKCPSFFVTKADIELLRASIDCESAVRNRITLLKNATVYYKSAISACLPKDIRIKNEAALKLAIVEGEIGSSVPQVPTMTKDEANQIISDARADGLFVGQWKLLDSRQD